MATVPPYLKEDLRASTEAFPLTKPDRKLCFLSFPIAQSNRSPDIQCLLQRFKFLNNIHLWLNQTDQEAHDHLCLVGQQTQSCYSNAFIKKYQSEVVLKIAPVNQ